MTTYRIYGNTGDYGSYAQVTRGFVEGFEANGVGNDRLDVVSLEEEPSFDEEQVGLPLADVAILAGAPAAAPRMLRAAKHEKRFVMIAPNSNKLPMRMMNTVNQVATGILVPSKWAAGVVEHYTNHPITVVPHGVLAGFRPTRTTEPELTVRYREEEFRILHLSSTSGERKGTIALLHAFAAALLAKDLPPHAELRLVLTPQAMQRVTEEFFYGRIPAAARKNIVVSGRLGLYGASPEEMGFHYSSAHLVCQPSRGEGFGLVPLEALVCGTPVVATTCTGHSEWAWSFITEHSTRSIAGLVCVPTGEHAPIDDMPDAVAPSLSVGHVRAALAYAYVEWERLKQVTLTAAPALAARWSWQNQLKDFVSSLE